MTLQEHDILRLLEGLVQFGIRPGGQVVFRAAAAQAGADVDAVQRYVLEHGGERIVEAGREGWLIPKALLRPVSPVAW